MATGTDASGNFLRPSLTAGPHAQMAQIVLRFNDLIEMEAWVDAHNDAIETLEAARADLEAARADHEAEIRQRDILARDVIELQNDIASVVAERDEAIAGRDDAIEAMERHLGAAIDLQGQIEALSDGFTAVCEELKDVTDQDRAGAPGASDTVNAPTAAGTHSPVTTPTAEPTVKRPRLSKSERRRLMRQRRCFNCKNKGHQTRECTTDWKPMSSIQPQVME